MAAGTPYCGRRPGFMFAMAGGRPSILIPNRLALKQKNCVILDGEFLWTAAAGVVHRVCRIGRESKTARGKQVLGHRDDLVGDVNRSSDNAEGDGKRSNRTQGVAEGSRPSPAATNPHRPRSRRGNPTPRRKGKDDNGSVSTNYSGGTVANTHLRGVSGDASIGKRPETATIDERTVTSNDGQEGDGERQAGQDEKWTTRGQDKRQAKQHEGTRTTTEEATTTPLSKEAAFLKATEVTEGGQGAMLFSEFVEAVTRLCLTRYGAWAAPRGGGPAPPSTTSKTNGFRVGLRKQKTGLNGSAFAARSSSSGRSQNVRGSTQQSG